MKETIERGSYQAIRKAEWELEDAQREYLKRHGWTSTCGVPGSFWVWVKVYAGERLMAGTSLAVSMQKSITCDECEHPANECVCTDE